MRRPARLTAPLLLLLACGGDDPSAPAADAAPPGADAAPRSADAAPIPDAAPPSDTDPPRPDAGLAPLDAGAASAEEWARVRGAYGELVTIAGTGAVDRGNDWKPAFEGKPGRDAELSRPHFAMADGAGGVYIADKEAHAIRRVGKDGLITTVAGTGEPGDGDDAPGPARARALWNPNGLFVLPDGTFYVLDLGNQKIRKVTPDGQCRTLFKSPVPFGVGRGLHVRVGSGGAETEVFFVGGDAIMRWTPAGGASPVAEGFLDLGNIAFDRRGRMLVTDRRAHKVFALVLDPATGVARDRQVVAGDGSSGAPRDGAPALQTPFPGVRAVWPAHPADGDGYFLGLHEGSQIWFVDGHGVAHLFLDGARNAFGGDGAPFDAPGKKVSELRSVALDAQGNVIVVESDEGRVRVVKRR